MGELFFDGRPVDRAAAAAMGTTADDLRALVRRGAVRQPVRGVYLDAGVTEDLDVRAACLALKLPRGAAISRLTAAWLLGVDGRSPDERHQPLAVECTVPVGTEPVRRPGVRAYVAPLDGDVELVHDVPCTSPVRTVVDVLRWRPPHMGLAVADALARRRLVDVDEVVLAVEAFRGRPGVARARYLAANIEPRSESYGESWLRLRVVDAGFPRPEAQVSVRVEDVEVYRLDLAWPRLRVALEYDGEEHHSSREQRAQDARRRDDLELRFGWTLLAVGKGEVLGPSLALERAVGELLSLEPRITRRPW
jgi:hypothetical protein